MELTVVQLIAAREAARTLADTDLPVRAAYEVVRLLQRLDQELYAYDRQRQGLFEKYGEQTPATPEQAQAFGASMVTTIKDEHLPAFQQALQELQALSVSMPDPTTITLGNGLHLKPRVLLALTPVLMIEVAP